MIMMSPTLKNLPVFGICGHSGSGKTTLMEEIIPLLIRRGLRTAVVKHTPHEIDVDSPGKDSDRCFKTGADVLLQGQGEDFLRIHRSGDTDMTFVMESLARRYDIVLGEGGKNLPVTKVWLLSENENTPPRDIDGLTGVLPFDSNRSEKVITIIDEWLPKQWLKTPVYGCVLAGGGSARMGAPKHLIVEEGNTWIERTVKVMKRVAEKVVIAGDSTVPVKLNDCICLPDAPGISGPLAGILSVMRWSPYASWLVAACDLPALSDGALEWILSHRRPGTWAVMPRLSGSEHLEPLLAYYDFRAHVLFEKLAAEGKLSPASIARNPKVLIKTPPENIASAWKNINTEEELRTYRNKKKGSSQ